MTLAALIVTAGSGWLIAGCVVALVFLLFGVDRILEDARDVYLFRVLVAPGVVLLWPIVVWRWYLREKAMIAWQDRHTPRRKLAGLLELAMAVSLLVLLAVAVVIGKDPAPYPEPVKLGAIVPAARAVT